MMEKIILISIQLVHRIITEVINGGRVSNNKGVNIPETFIKLSL